MLVSSVSTSSSATIAGVKAIIFPAVKGFFVGIVIKRMFQWLRREGSKG
jgi:hypothetical protein